MLVSFIMNNQIKMFFLYFIKNENQEKTHCKISIKDKMVINVNQRNSIEDLDQVIAASPYFFIGVEYTFPHS